MSDNIYTPITLWNNFTANENITVSPIVCVEKDGYIKEDFYLNVSVNEEAVKVYARKIKKINSENKNLIFALYDFKIKEISKLDKLFCENGYDVLTIDLEGKTEGKAYYTEYSEKNKIANLKEAPENLYSIETEVFESCWYVWSSVVKNVFSYYVKGKEYSKIGVFSNGDVANMAWILLGTEKKIACATIVNNSGWQNYRGHFRFSEATDNNLTDSEMKYIAGFDPQTYAQHVNCPLLLLSSTNNNSFSFERAYSTISRIDRSIYSAVDYSVGLSETVEYNGLKNMFAFYSVFFNDKEDKKYLPKDMEISYETNEKGDKKELTVEVKTREEDIKNLTLYICDGEVNPALRAYKAVTEYTQKSPNIYEFKFSPSIDVKRQYIFIKMEVKGGLTSCSDVISVKYTKIVERKYNVLYSSIQGTSLCEYVPLHENKEDIFNIDNIGNVVQEKEGKKVKGITCSKGLKTYKINGLNYGINSETVLILDVCSKEEGEFKAKYITDVAEGGKEYTARIKLIGNNVWQNLKLIVYNFKSEEGAPLRKFENLNAIAFEADCEFVINNVLTV